MTNTKKIGFKKFACFKKNKIIKIETCKFFKMRFFRVGHFKLSRKNSFFYFFFEKKIIFLCNSKTVLPIIYQKNRTHRARFL